MKNEGLMVGGRMLDFEDDVVHVVMFVSGGNILHAEQIDKSSNVLQC